MKFSVTTILYATLFLFSLVLAAPVEKRDVFVPPVLTPTTGDVWKIGSIQNVTWDVSNAPEQITNPTGKIVLKKPDGLLDFEHPLAQKFDITTGIQKVTVPDVPPASGYSIVVFGDSGNSGKQFTITN